MSRGTRDWVLPPPPVTVYIRGPIIRAIYNNIMLIVQLLLRGGSTETTGQKIMAPESIRSFDECQTNQHIYVM